MIREADKRSGPPGSKILSNERNNYKTGDEGDRRQRQTHIATHK
jgi:hypothetical protein